MMLPDLVGALRYEQAPTPLSDAAMFAAAEAEIGPEVVAWAVATASDTRGLVVETNPDVDDLPVERIGRTAEAMLLDLARELAGQPMPSPSLSADQREIVRYTVERGLPADRIVSSLRTVQQCWTRRLLANRSDPDSVHTVVAVVSRYFDRVVDKVLSEYRAQSEYVVVSAEAQRRKIIANLIDGEPVDSDLVRARLGVEPTGEHLALLLHGDEGDDDAQRLRCAANLVNDLVRSDVAVAHEVGPGSLGVWLSNPRTPGALEQSAPQLAHRKLRLVAGSVHGGPSGFRRSHREALAAEQVAAYTGDPVVCYGDIALAALLGIDIELAGWFVRDHLGPLAGRDPGAAELRATLAEFYRHNHSLVAAAAPLHVHRNTVVYRVRRIERLLGHPVTESVPEVRSALLLAETYGDFVLSDEA